MHPAVDIGVAGFSDGFGLGLSDDVMNNFDYDFQINDDLLQTTDENVDIGNFINLDGLVDSKDTASNNQNWLSSYIPGSEPQVQSDSMTLMPDNLAHLPTLSAQPLF